jgi:Bacteriophage holin family
MTFGDILTRLSSDPLTNGAIIAIAVLAILDFATGSLRAIANHTFSLDAFDVWVRVQIAGRVLPIILVLVAGTIVGDISVGGFSFNVLTATALAAAATYAVSTGASIAANLSPETPHPVPTE